jgi:hypothetical protein
MIGKLKEAAEAARLRAGVWMRERKERAEEKKLQNRRRYAEHGAPLLWVWLLVFIAVSTLIGSTWMLLVFIAGSVGQVDWAFDWRAGNDGEPARWNWFAEANIHAIYGGGLFLFCLGIATFNAVWLHIRHYLQGLFLNVATGIGIAIALFMISGAIVTQQWGTDARTRDQVVNANTAQAGVAAVGAEIAAIETEMARLCAPNLTTYQAQACRSGEVAWTERMATARTQRDYQLAGIERALADARQGDRWRARLLELRQQAAVASVETVEAVAATVTATGFMATFSRFLEEIRKPFIAVLGELLAMTMFGVALAAWRSRVPAMDIERSGWADEAHRIEDLRHEPVRETEPLTPMKRRYTDADTGDEIEESFVRAHKRERKIKRGEKVKVQIQPDIPPDETGAQDGGNRTASVTIGGLMEAESVIAAAGPEDEGHQEHTRQEPDAEAIGVETAKVEQDEPSDELPVFEDETNTETQDPEPTEAVQENNAEPDQEREPETRKDRMLPSSVAAE